MYRIQATSNNMTRGYGSTTTDDDVCVGGAVFGSRLCYRFNFHNRPEWDGWLETTTTEEWRKQQRMRAADTI
ncbi:hypothetical protein OUZ56_004240 [Daphnia magna]|uniref:Uncharacterized protein n=1 Tax=Daphnia magna TaxID=35525 RepID=A0ABQ9YPA7_9CRUS|nr:hypothetical protein OUZ56_004240 [Daphnia magna]